MQTQPSNTCRVYLHPTAASNPATISLLKFAYGLSDFAV
jgi:hypothetical protein